MTTIIESLPATCSIVKLDCGSFVMPWKEFRVSASQLARLAMATVMSSIAAPMLAEVEREMAKEAKRRAKIPEGRALSVPSDFESTEGFVHLGSARSLGLPVIVTDEGRLYMPDPHRPRDQRQAAVMDKFDKIAPVQSEGARLDRSKLSAAEAELLGEADSKLASADGRKDERTKISADGVIIGHGRMTQAERDERRYAQSVFTQLGSALAAKRDRAEDELQGIEATALDELRGKGAITAAKGQRRRRGAIERLVDGGVLTRAEGVALEKYGNVFESMRESLRSQMGGSTPGVDAIDIERELAEQARKDEARKVIKAAEKAVSARARNGRAVMILREVAGRGRAIHQVGGGGYGREQNRQALVCAAQALTDFWGLT